MDDLNPEAIRYMLEEHARRLDKLESLEAATKLALIQRDFASIAQDIREMKADVADLKADKERNQGKGIAGKAIYAYGFALVVAVPTIILSIVNLVQKI